LGYTFPGRFTDGQNWVDYFPIVAKSFGVDISPATAYLQNPQSASATNFAVGGATSGEGNVFSNSLPGFQIQVLTYLKSGQRASGNDLYVIWIGANDFSAVIGPAQTVANIKRGIAELSDAGARNFVVINVPDISLTPLVQSLGGATVLAAKQYVLATNVLLGVELPLFALQHGIRINLLDINVIFVPLVYSPGSFGFTNSTGAAFNPTTGVVVSDPNDYVFWDGFHPTTRAHYIGAEFIFKAIFLRAQFHNFLSIR
jgi:phospholipase/lecithinase/hemolysin